MNRYFPVGIGRYFSVFTIPIPKEISVGTLRYHFFGGNPFFLQKGGIGPLFEEKGGTGPLFDTASPPFAEKRRSRQISNTDRKYYHTSQKLYVSTKMSVMKLIFAPLLLRCKEPPMHKQHCRSSIDTMKSLSPAALTLKPLSRPSNRSSPRQHFIRLCSHIVHVVYRRTWYD